MGTVAWEAKAQRRLPVLGVAFCLMMLLAKERLTQQSALVNYGAGQMRPLSSTLPDGLACSKFMTCSSTRVNDAIAAQPSEQARAALWDGGLKYSGGSGG